MEHFDRREFLSLVAAGLAGHLFLPGLVAAPRLSFAGEAVEEPHFLLHFLLNGGADPAYLFDARPLEMTRNGVMQNYLGREPAPWAGGGGDSCLATSLTDPLRPFRDRFSVLNGVMMETRFDGHDQNMSSLFAGDPFGGDSYLPHLSRYSSAHSVLPMDIVQTSGLHLELKNDSSAVTLEPGSLKDVIKRLHGTAFPGADTELGKFLQARAKANAAGSGAFSQASRQLLEGITMSPSLQEKLLSLPTLPGHPDPDLQFAEMVGLFFRHGISRSCLWILKEPFDVHSPPAAAAQPKLFAGAVSTIARTLEHLRATRYDRTRSLLDVTTFVVTSEFGRSMRQKDHPLDATGTDHNPFSNSVLIGGKGIRGGLVVGASDFRVSDEKLSKAHLSLDGARIKAVGRPFDLAAFRSRSDLPEEFEGSDYLSIHSVVNTLYSLFQVDPARYRRGIGKKTAEAAPVLRGLLS